MKPRLAVPTREHMRACGQRPANAARRRLRTALRAALLTLALAPNCAAHAQMRTADLNVKSRYGDWEVACKMPPGAKKEICALVQTVAAEDDDNVVISVHFLKYSDGVRVLRIFTPLGVALGKGLRLNIDDSHTVQVGYSRCAQYGCFAQIEPDDQLFELLKTGKRVLIVIYRTQEAGIGIPISLSGFNAALAALQ